jgi:hypothetical protein
MIELRAHSEERGGMTTPDGLGAGTADDPLPEALALVQGASQAGHQLKILGGLGVRVLCPDFPPRQRAGQDIDLACLGKTRRQVASHLEQAGCEPDKRFNNLNGDRQMYFTAPSGRPIDLMVDRLSMCHALDLRPSFGSASAQSPTLDPADLLLSKLQIVELNAKDAHDIFHLLSGVRVGPEATWAYIDPDRFGSMLAGDWGWWRTVTGSLAKLPDLLAGQPALAPAYPRFDPLTQAKQLLEIAEAVPKSLKWKTRARVGERVRWYELPEEVDH